MNVFSKTILWTALFATMSVCGTFATTATGTMLLQLKNGESIRFELQSRPVVSFSADSIYLKSAAVVAALPYAYNDIAKMEFEDVATSIDTVDKKSASFGFVMKDAETIKIYGEDIKQWNIAAYTTYGKTLPVKTIADSNSVVISLEGVASGVYVIRVNGKSYKIYKK